MRKAKFTVHEETSTHWRVTDGWTNAHVVRRDDTDEFRLLTGPQLRFKTFGAAVGAAVDLIRGTRAEKEDPK